MKNLVLLFAFILTGFSSTAQSKLGTIDAEYILTQMPEMKTVNDSLQVYGENMQAELEASISEYESLVKEYQEKSSTYTEDMKKAKEDSIISIENDIKGFRQKASVMMQMKRNELTQPLYDKINTAMLAVIKEDGYTQIFHAGGNALAYSSAENDITAKVMQKLGLEIPAE
ncbi:MAG TPA: OmpH family outer membrane protein [Salinimicrobium sp.]|nr:OmpH family outer membrane protein [Salinimicrobium sp.]